MVDGGREPQGDASRVELEARRARRRAERRRRQVRRRRIVALLALAGVVAAVGLVLGSTIGGGGRAGKGGRGAGRARAGATEAEGPVRNATPQPYWEPHRGPVPILEYHVLGEAPPGTAYPELFVARPDFRHQLEWLDENGYQAVTLEQVQEAWYRGGTL